MEDSRNKLEIPPEGIDTPSGYLYYPPKQGTQILFLIASFFSSILLGFIISSIPGDLSELASGVLYFIYLLVFIFGYAAWASWVSALLFDYIKLPLLKILFSFIFRKKKPGSVAEMLPEREKLIELMVRAQKAAKIFLILSLLIGTGGALLTTFFSTSMDASLLFVIVLSSVIAYGYLLSYYGRRGYLPFPEE